MSNVLLVILDGVGEAPPDPGNAVKLARTPFLDALYEKHPWTLLQAAGDAIGAPGGVAGSSEPGHLTMGAGRVVWQPFEEINQSIKLATFAHNEVLRHVFEFLRETNGTLHLIGLLSDGGIHSHINHCYALLDAARNEGIGKVAIHAIADGRDVPEQSVGRYIKDLRSRIEGLQTAYFASKKPKDASGDHRPQIVDYRLSTLIGRYYALDRDRNWERTEKAYRLYAHGDGEMVDNLEDALEAYFSTALEVLATDYYLPPMKLDATFTGISEGDAVIFWNFRADRAEQLTESFAGQVFSHFSVKKDATVPRISFTCLGPYSSTLPVAFPTEEVQNGLGSWLARKGVRQLRIAETEKFAHVTFFFNGQVHEPCWGEERIVVSSRKNANYADNPAMSAQEITEEVCQALRKKEHSFIVVNYANGDVVGHGGDVKAVVQAMETLDSCLSTTIPEAVKNGYAVVLTADHGNAEHMTNADGSTNPSHTVNPVRCAIVRDWSIPTGGKRLSSPKLRKGMGLACIAPTVLELMGIEKPPEMGRGLIEKFV